MAAISIKAAAMMNALGPDKANTVAARAILVGICNGRSTVGWNLSE